MSTLSKICNDPDFLLLSQIPQPAQKKLGTTLMTYLDNAARKNAIQNIFREEYFQKGLLRKLSSLWNSTEIRDLFETVCKDLVKGTTGISICDALRLALEDIIMLLVQKVVLHMSRNLGLATMLNWDRSNPDFQKYVVHSIQALDLPSAKEVANNLALSMEAIAHVYVLPPALPFSSYIIGCLEKIWKQIKKDEGRLDQEVFLIFLLFPPFSSLILIPFRLKVAEFEKVIKDSSLSGVASILEKSELFDIFRADFLGIVFNFFRISPPPSERDFRVSLLSPPHHFLSLSLYSFENNAYLL